MGKEEEGVNFLQYANDTIFLRKASMENFLVIKSIMRCFELVSGLKVDFHKSNFGAIGVEERMGLRFAQILNCRLLSLPFTYVRVPIGTNPRRLETDNQQIQKEASLLET